MIEPIREFKPSKEWQLITSTTASFFVKKQGSGNLYFSDGQQTDELAYVLRPSASESLENAVKRDFYCKTDGSGWVLLVDEGVIDD